MNQKERADAVIAKLRNMNLSPLAGEMSDIVGDSQNSHEYGGCSDGSIDERAWYRYKRVADALASVTDEL